MADLHPLSGVSYEIHQELDAPTTPTTGTIFYWLEANAGKLNNKIGTFYSFVSGDYTPVLGHDEKDVLKALYYQYYYNNKARTSLLGLESNNISSLKDDQSSVTFVNSKDIARVYRDMAEDERKKVNDLANLYKHNRSGPRDPEFTWSGHWE